MNKSELKKFYEEAGCPSGNDLKRTKFKEFKFHLKREFAFISEMGGRKEISVYLHALMNDIHSPPSCIVCGELINKAHNHEFPKTCSRKCNGFYTVELSKERNDGQYLVTDPEVKEKRKLTCLERYGVDHPMKSEEGKKAYKEALKSKTGYENQFQSPEVKKKIIKTNLEKYGVTHPMKNIEIQEKAKSTLLERTGFDNPMKDPEILEKSSRTCLEKYGVDHYSKTEMFSKKMQMHGDNENILNIRRGRIQQETIDVLRDPERMLELYNEYGGYELSLILGVHNTTVYDWLTKHGIERENSSFFEKSFEQFLRSHEIEFVKNDRDVLNGLEIDFFIPSLDIGFELNGVWWHSTKYIDKMSHKNKTNLAKRKGVTLFHIFEDEWNGRRDQVKKKVLHLMKASNDLRVYARSTKFEMIPPLLMKEFFETNHIQGYGRGSLCGILRDQTNEIVAAAIFMRDPSNSQRVVLNRYATSLNVVGGMGKIVKNIAPLLKETGYQSIVSYADLRLSTGDLYEKCGWNFDGETPPDYGYVVGGRRIRKQNFRKALLKKKFAEYDENKTEIENMDMAGIPRIYDCGLARYTLDLV